MKLKSILKIQPLARLENILRFWNLQDPERGNSSESEWRDRLAEHLYPRLQMANYFQPAYAKLTHGERELVAFLVIHGGDLERGEVIRRQFGGNETIYNTLVTVLADKGFVFEDDLSDEEVGAILVGVPEPFIRSVDLPTYWEGYLGFFLRDMGTPQLKSLANTRLGITTETAKKNYLIHRIRQSMLSPTELAAYIERLTDSERQILDFLISKKGLAVYRDLLEGGGAKRFDHARAEHLNHLVTSSGLMFMASEHENKYSSLVMIPRDIFYILTHDFKPDTRSLNQLDTVSIIAREKQPSFVLDNSNNIMRDLVALAAFINSGQVRMLANGGLGKKDIKKVVPLLSPHKTGKYAAFLALFLISEKFIHSVGDVWKIAPTFPRWLENGPEAYKHLMRYWLDSTEWNEEYLEGDTVHADAYPANLINIVEVRRIALEHLEAIPTDRWLKFRAWVDTLMPKIEQALPKRASAATLDKVNRSITHILESILGESLFWMGLLSVGMENDSGLELLGNRGGDGGAAKKRPPTRAEKVCDEFAFRLTPLGEAILRSPWKEPDKLLEGSTTDHLLMLSGTADHFTVLPSMDIIAPPDLRLRTLYHLYEFCDPKTVDVTTTVTLSRESLRKGMDKGLRAEDIQRFLSDNSRTPLPETVKLIIRECSSKHGEVHLGHAGGYLLIDDPMLLEEFRNQKRLKEMIKDIIADRVVLLNSDVETKKLAKMLHKMGYMPHLDSDTVHVTQDSNFHLTLSKEELSGLMGALRYILDLEEEMAAPSATDDVRGLLERLRPEASMSYEVNFFVDRLSKQYFKKYETALKKRIEDVTAKYKNQVTKLIAATPRATSKYEFAGPNPATQPQHVIDMLDFAMDKELELEIVYLKTNQEESTERVEPQSIAGGKLYAFNPKRDSTAAYRLDRIKQATLV